MANHLPRPKRSRYYHLSSQQLQTLNEVLRTGDRSAIVAAAREVGLTPERAREAVWRWRVDRSCRERQYLVSVGPS